jgi:hypothetical protein
MSSLKQEDYNLHLKQHTPNPKTSTHQIGLIFRSSFRPVNPTHFCSNIEFVVVTKHFIPIKEKKLPHEIEGNIPSGDSEDRIATR